MTEKQGRAHARQPHQEDIAMPRFPLPNCRRFPTRAAAVAVVLASILSASIPGTVRAEDPPAPVASLALVPQNASFYTSMLRTREQLEIVAKSNFWKRLTELEVVKELWSEATSELTAPPSPVAGFFNAL